MRGQFVGCRSPVNYACVHRGTLCPASTSTEQILNKQVERLQGFRGIPYPQRIQRVINSSTITPTSGTSTLCLPSQSRGRGLEFSDGRQQ